MIVKRICQDCGAEFECFSTRSKRMLCASCAKRHTIECKRRYRNRDFSVLSKSNDAIKEVSNDEIMHAKKKPAGVSDARWRIELRRRADGDFYSQFGVPV